MIAELSLQNLIDFKIMEINSFLEDEEENSEQEYDIPAKETDSHPEQHPVSFINSVDLHTDKNITFSDKPGYIRVNLDSTDEPNMAHPHAVMNKGDILDNDLPSCSVFSILFGI